MAKERKSPWKRESAQYVYQNPWIKVREDQVLRPDGKPGIYGVVETDLAVGVIAVNDQQKITLVGQWRYAINRWSWEIVEGAAYPQESPIEAAKRELREEAGWTAKRYAQLGGDIFLSNSFTDERALVFLAEGLDPVPPEPDPTEQLELRYESLDTCLELMRSGEINDAITLIGLSRYAEHLRSGRCS